jgi:hypothetical protein
MNIVRSENTRKKRRETRKKGRKDEIKSEHTFLRL